MNHHGNGTEARILLDVAGQGEAVHFGHFQVGQHQGDLVAHGLAFSFCLIGDGLQFVPGFLARFAHDVRQAHGGESIFDHGARDERIVRCQDDGARLERYLGADTLGIDSRVVRRHDLTQDGFHVENLCQPIAILAIQPGEAGDHAAGAIIFSRQHLAPVETHDVLHRLDGKGLGAAGVLGNQQDIQPGAGRAPGNRRQIDDRQDLPAQIDHTHHVGWRSGHRGDHGHRNDLSDLEYIDAE